MTEKQIEKVRARIRKIRGQLTAEKRKFGWFDDSGGRRYDLPGLYIKIGDYKGGLTYFRWFQKNFPDDIGLPSFLFEWTIILFKNGKLEAARKKAFEAYCRNVQVFDRFFGRPLRGAAGWEMSNLELPEFLEHFPYSSEDPELADFTEWLSCFEQEPEFVEKSRAYIALQEQLQHTQGGSEERRALLDKKRELKRSFGEA